MNKIFFIGGFLLSLQGFSQEKIWGVQGDFGYNIIIIFLLIGIAALIYFRYKAKERGEINEKEIFKKLEKDKEELTEVIDVLRDYKRLFETYYNEDWNRNTPFLEHIDFIHSVYVMYIRTLAIRNPKEVSLSRIVKDIEIEEKQEERMKLLFGEHTEAIKNFSLGKLFMFSADMKTYQNGTGNFCNDGKTSTDEFLKKAVEHYNK